MSLINQWIGCPFGADAWPWLGEGKVACDVLGYTVLLGILLLQIKFLKNDPDQWLAWLECCPEHQKFAGSIPVRMFMGGNQSVFLSHINISSGEDLKVNKNISWIWP